MQPIRKRLTPTRVLVGLLVLVNLAMAVFLLRSSQRTTELERRIEGKRPSAPAREAPSGRAARRAGQGDEGNRRPTVDESAPGSRPEAEPEDAESAGAERRLPPDDPEKTWNRLAALANPTDRQERIMREAFDRFYPEAEAAYHAGDEALAKDLWWKFCDDVTPVLSEMAERRLGCKRHDPPPPSPTELGRPAPPPPLELPPRQPSGARMEPTTAP